MTYQNNAPYYVRGMGPFIKSGKEKLKTQYRKNQYPKKTTKQIRAFQFHKFEK